MRASHAAHSYARNRSAAAALCRTGVRGEPPRPLHERPGAPAHHRWGAGEGSFPFGDSFEKRGAGVRGFQGGENPAGAGGDAALPCCRRLIHDPTVCGRRVAPQRQSRMRAFQLSSTIEAMPEAAKEESALSLAALPLCRNSHPAHRLPTALLYPRLGLAISITSPDLLAALYDMRVRSRSTGKERDTETGLDYFGARYYSSGVQRFLSADMVGDGLDPVPVPWADFQNPQSLNLYSYVRNEPLARSDPDGHDCVVQSRTDYTKETVTVSSGNCDNVNIDDGQTKTYIAGTVDVSSIQSNGLGGITFGYTPYEGGGVADLQGASIPDNPNLAYNWQNNAQGYRTLGTAAATVGSVKGVALFYSASAAAAACALWCPEAAPLLEEAANPLALKAMAYLESAGLPATAAAAWVLRLRPGAPPLVSTAWKELVPKLNEAIREYHQSQGAH